MASWIRRIRISLDLSCRRTVRRTPGGSELVEDRVMAPLNAAASMSRAAIPGLRPGSARPDW
jgi:hypothetical protein